MTFPILLESPFLALFFLFCSSIFAGSMTALQSLGSFETKEAFKKLPSLFFFQHFLLPFFKEKKWEGLLFSLSFTKHILRLCYAVTALFFLLVQDPFIKAINLQTKTLDILWISLTALVIIAASLLSDFFFTLIGAIKPKAFFKFCSPLVSFFLLLLSPCSVLFFKLLKNLLPNKDFSPSFKMRDKILEILHESDLGSYLDPNDQKLILSVVSFKERIAREVMVPRIDVFCLPAETTIQKAAQSFLTEGYSRIPVYRDSIDHIIGVLLYKDVLNIYAKASTQKEVSSHLHAAIESLVKPVLYTPETKKISHLLQEFRSKQIHLAIVVDEYGGTEGIVTIEDILEELVGEIADEFDIDEEILFFAAPTGGWVVDARMTILDIQEDLNIQIPQSPEYDTIGGYIYHRAGAIPAKGWRIHHDDFDLEVLSSDERSIDKIRITPHLSTNHPPSSQEEI